MQDPDDSDAAPHDMVLNKAKRNKALLRPFAQGRRHCLCCFLRHGGRPAATAAAGAHRPAAGNRFR